MELNPWEASTCWATQGIISIQGNPKVHYPGYKRPSLITVISQMTPVHTLMFNLRSTLIVSSCLCLSLPVISFLQVSLLKLCIAFLFSYICATWPTHPPWVHHHNNIWNTVQLTKLLVVHFPPASYYFLPFMPSAPYSEASSVYVHQVSCPYKTRKIVVLYNVIFIFLDSRWKIKDSALNGSKQPSDFICSQFLQECDFYLLVSFPDIWTLPHFRRLH